MWTYESLASMSGRAQQIWMILAGCARNRQTITYEDLVAEMGLSKKSARFSGLMLGPVLKYCANNNLPPLTVLVVGKGKGIPGKGFPRNKNLAFSREEVFNYKWFQICIPSRTTLQKYV